MRLVYNRVDLKHMKNVEGVIMKSVVLTSICHKVSFSELMLCASYYNIEFNMIVFVYK